MRPRIKICCIETRDDLEVAVAAGADAIGLVAEGLTPPFLVSDLAAAGLRALAPPHVEVFLLTGHVAADALIAQHGTVQPDTLQLCRPVPHEELARVRAALPRVRLIQVVHMGDPDPLAEARGYAPLVDAVLLDSGSLAAHELGGTGRTHDWAVSRAIRDTLPGTLWLAGGLRPDNVAEAIRTVRPDGVDVCSGVRAVDRERRLDPARAAAFVAAVREASREG